MTPILNLGVAQRSNLSLVSSPVLIHDITQHLLLAILFVPDSREEAAAYILTPRLRYSFVSKF